MLTVSGLAALVLSCSIVWAGRYEDLTRQYASGPKADVLAATFFGGAGSEEFVGAGERSDGKIVIAGNAWGPQLPADGAVVIGQGNHSGTPAITDDKKREPHLNYASEDRAGFIVVYAGNLKRIERIVRFDWGVASIEDLHVLEDDSLIVVGRTGPNATSIKAAPNSAFVARLSDKGLLWIQTVDGYANAATRAWVTSFGIYFRSTIKKNEAAMFVIGPDGKGLKKLAVNSAGNGVSDFHGVDPNTGEFYYGGDRNTNTGREPWRQPFMYVYDKEGNQTDTLWNWPPKMLRTDGYPANGEVSDSSIRGVIFDPRTGELLVNGWSDGGNSVFKREPKDIAKLTGDPSTSFTTWGMKNANSLAYVMRIRRRDWTVSSWCYWVSYIPQDFAEQRFRGAPNFASIKEMAVLSNGSIAFGGSSATGLIQTPNAFFKYANDGTKHGGDFITIQSPDQKSLLFSSYLPGSENLRLGAGRDGRLILVSRSAGAMKRSTGDIPAPTVNALQPTFGGQFDGHVILLKTPAK